MVSSNNTQDFPVKVISGLDILILHNNIYIQNRGIKRSPLLTSFEERFLKLNFSNTFDAERCSVFGKCCRKGASMENIELK